VKKINKNIINIKIYIVNPSGLLNIFLIISIKINSNIENEDIVNNINIKISSDIEDEDILNNIKIF
jgi:hypothetical protein